MRCSNVAPYAPVVTPYELDVRRERNGCVVVELAGELDLTNAADVERQLEDIVAERLILDLNRVTFLDSAALHMLFRTSRRGGPAQRLGIVLEPTALVARTLAIVGMQDAAVVSPTLDELLAARSLAPVDPE